MGVCLDKDVSVKDSLSVSSMPPPTSSNKGKGVAGRAKGGASAAATAVMATKELKKQISGLTGSSSADKKRKAAKNGKAKESDSLEPDGAGEEAAASDVQHANGADDVDGGLSQAPTVPLDDGWQSALGDVETAGTVVPSLTGEELDVLEMAALRSAAGSVHRLPSASDEPAGGNSPAERTDASPTLLAAEKELSAVVVVQDGQSSGRSGHSPSRYRRDDYSKPSSRSAMSRFPELTKPAPEFSGQAVVNGQFKQISLSDYKGKYVVLFFYPADFTFVCPTEIISFSEKADDFRKIGCEVIACSTDSQFSHFAWINTSRKMGGLGPMNIPMLADKTGTIARDYGCYKEDEGIAFRGLYIIDDKGRLRQITINDLPVGRSVDETLRLVQAFQYTDVHGEVCPANWKPGDATMKPDTHGSKEYFEKKH